MGQQETVKAQNQANQDWEATQEAAAQAAAQKDAVNQQKAQAALNVAQDKLSPASQTQTQQTAATGLNTQMLTGSPAAPDSNIKLLGQPQAGADTSVSSDMATRVTNAAREAQGRIAALAGLTSYGGGYGDMGSAATTALANSAEGINLASDFRKGDTATLGITQQIQPIQYAQGSNIAGSLAGSLAGIAGKGLGASLKLANTAGG
jgi:hypothetical protein